MNYVKPLSIRTSLLAALAGVLSLIPAASVIAGGPPAGAPAGDLTVTVEEQENGDVKFSLSGTAYMQNYVSGMSVTNFSSNPGNPPANGFNSFGLPSGLTLTMPDNVPESEIESPEEGVAPSIDHALSYIYFSGGWYLGGFNSGELYPGDPITGAGSVTASDIPFFHFVPGTFLVEPGGSISYEPEALVAEGESSNSGIYPYFITYEVIPFVQNPSLSLSHPGAFPKTILRKSGGSQRVTITNNGNAPLTGLSISVPGSRDFSSSALPATALAPGESTNVEVSFRPRREGRRTATLTVKGFYTPRQVMMPFVSAEEAAPEEAQFVESHEPVEVSASTQLSGKGITKPKPKRRPNSPRFPRGSR